MPETPTQSPPREPIEVTYAPVRRPLRKRIGWAFRSWARSTFSRESFVSSFKSLLWVVPLTVLIWVYAERDEDLSISAVPVTLDIRSSDPRMDVHLAGDGSIVHVDLKGRQADVEQIRDWLQTTPFQIEVPHDLRPGLHQIYLQSQLNQQPRVKSRGVTISNCTPTEVAVAVDEIIEPEIEVRARPEDSKNLAGPPVFTPSRVKLVGPRSVIDAARRMAQANGQDLFAYANFVPFKQQLTEPGKHSLSAVAVSASIPIDESNRVHFQPPAVSAEVVVSDKAERQITLPYLRVLAAYHAEPGPRADQYKVVYEPTLTNVTVSGPEQQINQLQDPNNYPTPAPAAIFEVNFNEVDNPGPISAPLMFVLPPGVHVIEQDAQRKITYSFKPRSNEPQ